MAESGSGDGRGKGSKGSVIKAATEAAKRFSERQSEANQKAAYEENSRKINGLKMPSMYRTTEITLHNGDEISVTNTKAGYGSGGFINVRLRSKSDGESTSIGRYGYGSKGMATRDYSNAREAFKDAKDDIKRRFLKK